MSHSFHGHHAEWFTVNRWVDHTGTAEEQGRPDLIAHMIAPEHRLGQRLRELSARDRATVSEERGAADRDLEVKSLTA
jgi:hypothetical protein